MNIWFSWSFNISSADITFKNWHDNFIIFFVNNWHKYCDELDKAALDEKTKPYAKREIIQLIHQIIKDNVLERNQTRKIEEIKDALLNNENSNGNNLINITEI